MLLKIDIHSVSRIQYIHTDMPSAVSSVMLYINNQLFVCVCVPKESGHVAKTGGLYA